MITVFKASPIQLIKTTFDNATLQGIVAGNELNVSAAIGRPFAMIAASLYYSQATTDFSLTPGGVSAVLNYRTGGDAAAVWQDTLSGSGFLKISANSAINMVVNYDPTAPNFAPEYSDSEINLVFDGDYQTGDGILTVYVWGQYL